MTDSSAVAVAVKSASYNIVLQVLMRILSSISNAVILRFITKDSLGVINVSREAFRRSCLSKFDDKNFQTKFNLLWLNIPSCLVCSLFLTYIWLNLLEQPSPHLVPDFSLGIYIVLFSVVIEIFAEPLYVFSQSYHFVKLKVIIEGVSLTIKSFSMVTFLWFRPGQAMHAFCISQGLSSCIYTAAFYIYFCWYFNKSKKENGIKLPIHSLKQMLPDFVNFFVDLKDLNLAWSFFKHNLMKQIQTEGERYVMTFFNVMSFAEQGLYDVVSNLGSLSARFVFLPIEESGYLLFSGLLSRDKEANSKEKLSEGRQILEKLLKLMLLLGLMILAFGYSYSQLLLLLYGGTILSSSVAVTLLKWHCAYVLLLALNGITECFKSAVMDQKQLDEYNKKMGFFTPGYLFAAFCFAKIFGGVGFIMANCLNMGFRIIHSIYFITKYFETPNAHFVKKMIPHPSVLVTLVLSLCLTSVSEVYFCCDQGFRVWIWHLCLGLFCFAVFILSVALKETPVVKFIYEQWSKKKVDSKKSS